MICVVKIFNFLVLVGGIQILHCPLQGLGNHPYSIIGITMKFAGLPIATLSIVFLFILLWSLQRRKTSVLFQYLTFYRVAPKPTPWTAPPNLEICMTNTEKAAQTKIKKLKFQKHVLPDLQDWEWDLGDRETEKQLFHFSVWRTTCFILLLYKRLQFNQSYQHTGEP